MAPVLVLVPAGADAHLDPPAAHLVDGDRDLGEVAGRPERDRRDQRPEPDRRRVAREPGEHRPGVGRRLARLAREALVVVGPEQRLEPRGLGRPGHGELLVVGEALLGLDHQREPHLDSCI